jgi:Bacteriophage HK97-gp10, putative tail-component
MARAYGPRDPYKLIVNRAELNRLLMSPSSPIAEDLAKRAQRAAGSAKRRAPKKTGALKSSVGWKIAEDDDGLYADVVATMPYATPVEQGHKTATTKRVAPRRFLRPALYSVARKRKRS